MKTMKTRHYPKGTIVLFEEGEYSDFGYCGQVVTLTDLDLDKAALDWRLSLGKDKQGDWIVDDWDHGPSEFVAHLIASQICAPLDCQTVHIGSYGRLSIGQVAEA